MSRLIEFDIALLLLRHGRKAVLEVLSRKLGLSEAELENELQSAAFRTSTSRGGARDARERQLEALIARHPDKGMDLRRLSRNYLDGKFLPTIRHVREFLAKKTDYTGTLHSRPAAFKNVLEALSALPPDELGRLAQMEEEGGYSSLGVIADEILKREQ